MIETTRYPLGKPLSRGSIYLSPSFEINEARTRATDYYRQVCAINQVAPLSAFAVLRHAESSPPTRMNDSTRRRVQCARKIPNHQSEQRPILTTGLLELRFDC